MTYNYKIESCKPNDGLYPKSLLEIHNYPSVLYYIGNIEALNEKRSVAAIGTRNASEEGLRAAYEIGYKAAQHGLITINGLAVGCDTAALQGAIDNNGLCIAVMPCGLDQVYPKSNLGLAQNILESGGCLISEYPIGTIIHKHNFIKRDRLQSALSDGVIVVESAIKGGSMHTAKYAIKQYKRISYYYSKLLEHMEGNIDLIEKRKCGKIENVKDLERFLIEINNEEKYEQLSLFDV